MAKKNFDDIDRNSSGLERLLGGNPSTEEKKEKPEPEGKVLMKTFQISSASFDIIEKYIKYRRMTGDVKFTQREAIEECVNLLKSKNGAKMKEFFKE